MMAPQVPVDPGTGLQDSVDFVLLAGISGLHNRFLELYKTLNPAQRGIGPVNMDMSQDYNFTGAVQINGLGVLGVLSRTTAINGKSVAATNLYTVPAGKTAFVTGAMLRLTAVTALTGTMAAGIGVAAGEDDIFASNSLIAFNALDEIYNYGNAGVMKSVAAGSVIKLGIDTAFGGTTATLEAFLMGFLV